MSSDRAVARDELPLPPHALRFMGEDDAAFIRTGDAIVARIDELCSLGERPAIIDVGSGYGRVGHALWRHGFDGHYLGLEILQRHVEWCQQHLAEATDGVLAFEHLDVYSERYNPNGGASAQTVRLPCDTASADLVLATSVFTHMYSHEVDHYLQEVSRVVRREGCALVTFFLLDESARSGEAAGKSRYPMPHRVDDATHAFDSEQPLLAIGYDPDWLAAVANRHGLTVADIRLGHWCGRVGRGPYLQDYVLLRPLAGPT